MFKDEGCLFEVLSKIPNLKEKQLKGYINKFESGKAGYEFVEKRLTMKDVCGLLGFWQEMFKAETAEN